MTTFSVAVAHMSIRRCSSALIFSRSISAWPLLQAHGAVAVRAGQLHLRQQLGMALEEVGVFAR